MGFWGGAGIRMGGNHSASSPEEWVGGRAAIERQGSLELCENGSKTQGTSHPHTGRLTPSLHVQAPYRLGLCPLSAPHRHSTSVSTCSPTLWHSRARADTGSFTHLHANTHMSPRLHCLLRHTDTHVPLTTRLSTKWAHTYAFIQMFSLI